MRYLVLDRQPDRLVADLIAFDDGPVVLQHVDLEPQYAPGLLDPSLSAGADAIVHRLIHAPDDTPEVCAEIDPDAVERAGRHEPADTAERLRLRAYARERWSGIPHPVVFDTAFFATLPAVARTYALPRELAERHNLTRRGRHGPVHRQAAAAAERDRVVSVLLDREASVAAIVEGRPIEVSAGMTALEGIPGGTTCGDIDPAIVLYLVDRLGRSIEEVERALSAEGGLCGISRGRATVADLRVARDADAELALRFLTHRVARYVGAYAALMGGLDALVIAAAPGFDDPTVGEALAARLEYLGVGDKAPLLRVPLYPAVAAAVAAAESLGRCLGST